MQTKNLEKILWRNFLSFAILLGFNSFTEIPSFVSVTSIKIATSGPDADAAKNLGAAIVDETQAVIKRINDAEV